MSKIVLVFVSLVCIAGYCFATEEVTKVDDYSAKCVVTSIAEKEGVKTTLINEKTFTLEELNLAKQVTENTIKSWLDKKKECEDNIVLQTNQLAMWERIIDKTKAAGVIEKPVEKHQV